MDGLSYKLPASLSHEPDLIKTPPLHAHQDSIIPLAFDVPHAWSDNKIASVLAEDHGKEALAFCHELGNMYTYVQI